MAGNLAVTLKGLSVLVTGAANGIGLALTQSLLAEGARVVAFDRDADGLRGLGANYGTQSLRQAAFDLTDARRLEEETRAALLWAGEFDAVVHCAGFGPYRPFLDYSRADWDAMMAVNLTAYADLVRLVLPEMIARGRGHLIAIGSERGEVQARGTTIYGATKAGLAAFSRALALDYGKQGVHVCVVAPGGVLTHFGATPLDDKNPHFLKPADVADAVIFMLRHRDRAWVRDMTLLPLGV